MNTPPRRRREAVLLDALGTLIELLPPAPRLRAALLERCGVSISLEQAERAIAAEIAYYRAHMGDGGNLEGLARLRRRCASELRAALPERLRPDDLDAVFAALVDALEFRPFDDARPALEAIRTAGARTVVASNWDVGLHEVLDRTGLAPLVDGVVVSAVVGAAKPSAAIFERALTIAGAAAAEALHVGDTVADDVEGARGAGIEPVLLRRGGGAGPPGVITIASLSELPALL